MKVAADGIFRVRSQEVSPILRAVLGEKGEGPVRVRMTEATLSIRGAPVHMIRWKLLEAQKEVEFSVAERTQSTFDGAYLVDAIDMLESGFSTFILGGRGDEQHA